MMSLWDPESAFDKELLDIPNHRPPVTKNRIETLVKIALDDLMQFKNVVNSVERFIRKTTPEHRLSGIYCIDAIIRASHSKHGSKDLFAERFAKNLSGTFQSCADIPDADIIKVRRVLDAWAKHKFFPEELCSAIKQNLPKTSSGTASVTVDKSKVKSNVVQNITDIPGEPLSQHDSFKDHSDALPALADVNTISSLLDMLRGVSVPMPSVTPLPSQPNGYHSLDSDVMRSPSLLPQAAMPAYGGYGQTYGAPPMLPNTYAESYPNMHPTQAPLAHESEESSRRKRPSRWDVEDTGSRDARSDSRERDRDHDRPRPRRRSPPPSEDRKARKRNDVYGMILPPDQEQIDIQYGSPSDCHAILSKTLWVGNVPQDVDEQTFRDLFNSHGRVDSCTVYSDKSMAFVRFGVRQEASDALTDPSGYSYNGRRLKVNWGCDTGDKKWFDAGKGVSFIPISEIGQ